MTPPIDEPTVPEEGEEPPPPVGHVRVVYLGPVAPHWEVQSDFGDPTFIEEFRQRTLARLVLLPPTTRSTGGTGSGWSATPSARTSRWSGTSVCPRRRPRRRCPPCRRHPPPAEPPG